MKDKLLEPWLHWVLFVGIVVVPVLLSAVTSEVAFSRSKSLEFCASCHVMDGHVNDLKDPKSENLAAKHYQYRRINQDQCYTCHTDYDFLGPVNAKIGGMKHLVHFYLSKERPLKLYKPYKNARCLHCHEGAKSYLAAETHKDIFEQIKSEDTSCIDCHGPVHPREEGKGK